MNIYSCVDSKNIDKIFVLFYSCFLNSTNKDSLKFYIVTDSNSYDISNIPNNIKHIIKIKSVEFSDIWLQKLKDFNENFYQNSSWCKNDMNFARFLFFKVFPDVKRAIYLDWDMIVQGDIYELIKDYNSYEKMVASNISGKSIYHNIFNIKFKGNMYSKNPIKINKVISLLNTDAKTLTTIPHFCAGFYIISDFHFEENYMLEFIQNLIDIQKKFKCFNFGTQSVMNLMHLNNRIFVDRLWNLTPDKDDINKIKIIHWNGHSKPWNDKEKEINKIWWIYSNIINK